jgi:hypothetical protein
MEEELIAGNEKVVGVVRLRTPEFDAHRGEGADVVAKDRETDRRLRWVEPKTLNMMVIVMEIGDLS